MSDEPTLFPSMSSAAASLVRILAGPTLPAWDSAANGLASGGSTLESFARFDPDTWQLKTSQLCLLEGLTSFSESLPESGTMRSGVLYRHAPWVHHTCDDDCSLWPTPTASMDGRGFGIPLHTKTGRYKLSTVERVHALVGAHGWRIHPHFTEALMGFETEWSATMQSVTPSSRRSRKSSAG
jgi:hypothetical protein